MRFGLILRNALRVLSNLVCLKNDLHIYLAAATIIVAVLALSGPKYHDQFSDLGVLTLA